MFVSEQLLRLLSNETGLLNPLWGDSLPEAGFAFRLSFTPVCRRFRNRNSRLAFLFGKLHSQHEILKPGVIMQESQPGIHPEKGKRLVAGRECLLQPGEGLFLVAEPGKDHSKSMGGNVLSL